MAAPKMRVSWCEDRRRWQVWEAGMSDRDLEAACAALLALTKHNVPPDVQELLVYGNPDRKITLAP